MGSMVAGLDLGFDGGPQGSVPNELAVRNPPAGSQLTCRLHEEVNRLLLPDRPTQTKRRLSVVLVALVARKRIVGLHSGDHVESGPSRWLASSRCTDSWPKD